MNETPRVVIVGAGVAGMCSAERLRELGFDGEIVIVGAEASMPVYRPALSKQFLTGEISGQDIVNSPACDLDAVWRLSTAVSQLDAKRRVVHLPGGEELEYDGLIIATGVEARRLPNGVNGHPRVSVLRTTDDSRRVRQALLKNRDPVLVIGTGFIGCEVASSVRHAGRPVILVGRSETLMSNLLDANLGRRLTTLHRQNKAQLKLGVSVKEWALRSSTIAVRFSDGSTVEAGSAVVAVGSVPVVSWLRDSGAELDNGIVCESTCHVVGLEDVVAAGDVARWPNLRFGGELLRVEHWTHAIEMGRAAAESLLSGRESATAFTPVPRFWSEQYGLRIQAAGMTGSSCEMRSLDENPLANPSLTGYFREGRLAGVVGFDNSAVVMSYADRLRNHEPMDSDNPTTWTESNELRDRPVQAGSGPHGRLQLMQATRMS